MSKIMVQTPHQNDGQFVECDLIEFGVNTFTNKGEFKIRGYLKTNVNTWLYVSDVRPLLKGEEVKTEHGYFKLHIINEKTLTELNQIIFLENEKSKVRFSYEKPSVCKGDMFGSY